MLLQAQVSPLSGKASPRSTLPLALPFLVLLNPTEKTHPCASNSSKIRFQHCLPLLARGSLCPQVKTELNGRELKVKGPCNNFRVPEAAHGSPGIINKGNVLEPELQSKQLQEHSVC